MNKLEKRLSALEETQNPIMLEVLFASDEIELKEAEAKAEQLMRDGCKVTIVHFV